MIAPASDTPFNPNSGAEKKGCRQNLVGQAFQPAGSPDFPVRCFFGTGDWKVARTRRLESLRDNIQNRPAIFSNA